MLSELIYNFLCSTALELRIPQKELGEYQLHKRSRHDSFRVYLDKIRVRYSLFYRTVTEEKVVLDSDLRLFLRNLNRNCTIVSKSKGKKGTVFQIKTPLYLLEL